MADNTELNPGTGGDTVATDDIAGVKYQRVKMTIGADGVNDGDINSANPMPVSGAFWQATQPVSAAALPLPAGAATEATLAALATALGNHDAVADDGRAGFVILAKRRDSDAAAMVADGDLGFLSLDETQRLKVSTQPASYVLGIGSITANAQTVFLNVERASNVAINMVATTLTGHNATFEYSHNSTNGTDGNWYVAQAVRSNANTVETATGVLAATPVYGWEFSVNAYKWIRIRATAHTGGTAAYTITPGAYATEPIPAVQVTGTQPISGTVTATVTGGTVLPVTPTTAFTNSAATTNATSTKASAGTVWSVFASNINAAVRYLKLYNKASAPTVGTDVPVMIIPIPAGGFVQIGPGSNGIRFATGIAWALTSGAADSDTGAVSVNEHKVAISYT
jgi:hypothetical protein